MVYQKSNENIPKWEKIFQIMVGNPNTPDNRSNVTVGQYYSLLPSICRVPRNDRALFVKCCWLKAIVGAKGWQTVFSNKRTGSSSLMIAASYVGIGRTWKAFDRFGGTICIVLKIASSVRWSLSVKCAALMPMVIPFETVANRDCLLLDSHRKVS